MYAIMTVTGADHTGIVGAVTQRLATLDINILDISQTIMGQWFTMILRVQIPEGSGIVDISESFGDIERDQAISVRLQSEELFTAVNEI